MTIWGTPADVDQGPQAAPDAPPHAGARSRSGPPVPAAPDDKPVEVTQPDQRGAETLLHQAQESYPDQPSGPDDTWWLPVRLGGSAPTPEQARELDDKQGHLG